jgi:hypothetical protein
MSFNRTKRTIYIIIGVLILIIIGILLWQNFASPPETPRTPSDTKPISGNIPRFPVGDTIDTPFGDGLDTTSGIDERDDPEAGLPPEERTLLQLTDFSTVAPSLNKKDDKIFFYKKDGGDLFSSDFDGKSQEKLSNITILGMTEALWSPERDRAAIFYLDEETIKGFLLIGTSSVAVLPTNIKSFSWSPRGSLLAYLTEKNEELALTTTDLSGKNARTIFSTPILDAHIAWADADTIAFQTAPSGLAEGFLFGYSRSSGNFSKILGPRIGLISLFSPDGKRILISTSSNGGKQVALTIHNTSGTELFKTGLATIPQKCAWAGDERLYCAVPRGLERSVLWPDDYLRGELNTDDRIVLIDLKNKETRTVFSDDAYGFDMSNLVVTEDETHLFFVNRWDGTLWRLRLK